MTVWRNVNFLLSALSIAFGVLIALSTLDWGPWNDEFWTVASTAAGMSVRDFLGHMYRDQHPILHYGLIYLAQTIGTTDIVALRSLNLLGLGMVGATLAYAHRHKAISPAQIMVVGVVFMSSPLSLSYFSELRAYFLLYSASISISVLWWMLVQRIDQDRSLPPTMIVAWGACLAIFVNLHYFATIFGGVLTLALLASLASRGNWRLAWLIGLVGLAAATPALLLGAMQAKFSLSGQMGWITTTLREAIRFVIRIVKNAAAFNLVAAACAITAALFLIEDGKRRSQQRNVMVLIGLTALFFAVMIGLNAIVPMIRDRYLMSAAGAVTVAVALLAAGPGSRAYNLRIEGDATLKRFGTQFLLIVK